MRTTRIAASFAALMLAFCVSVWAKDRPHEGKIVNVDPTAMVMTVQGEDGDQWTLYWTETTKLKGDLAIQEVKVGDKVHFEYVEKDGRMWLSELKRTDKAKD